MSTHDEALFQRNMGDTVVKIYNNTLGTPRTFEQLLGDHPEQFFTAKDTNGVTDFCAHVPDGQTITVEAIEQGTTDHYTLSGNVFVGPSPLHPPTR